MPSPAQPSPLPSPPTSPTSPRAATARIRIKTARRPDSLYSFPSTRASEGSADQTRRLSQPFSRIATTDGEDAEIRPTLTNKRRQSSIAYYTPSSPSPWSQRPYLNRTSSFGGDGPRDSEPALVNGNLKENLSKRSSLVLSTHTPSTRDSLSSLDAGAAREREPLTLVEKHADLLHYIAQKERKCLELRDQLAVHEKELAELKRKWERIVNRGHDPFPNPPLAAGIGGAAIDGLKEGVRMIAAGFSDLSEVIHELESGGDNDSSKTNPLTHTPRQNNASAKRADSEHHSISSTSSRRDSMYASNYIHDGREVVTVATVPSLTRAGSLNSRMHKRASRTISNDPTPPISVSVSPSPQSSKSADLDVGMSLILAPSPTLVPPLLGALSVSGAPGPKSLATGSTHGSVSTAGPISSWVDSMGKKLSELQSGQTFTKGQKRASSLLAGVSSSISSALSPGPIATTPAPLPDILTSSPALTKLSPPSKRPPLSRPPLAPEPSTDSRSYPTYKSMADWLEDDEEQTVNAGKVLMPDVGRRLDAPAVARRNEAGTTTIGVSSFDDDWNW